jgi:hypothetical protein
MVEAVVFEAIQNMDEPLRSGPLLPGVKVRINVPFLFHFGKIQFTLFVS